jgi:hypothetical protein
MNKIDDILEQLKGQQPVIDDPDALTDRIMSSLPDQDEDAMQPKARTVKMHWLWTAISAAACVAIALMLAWPKQGIEPQAPSLAQNTSLRTDSPNGTDSQSEQDRLTVRTNQTNDEPVKVSKKERNSVSANSQTLTKQPLVIQESAPISTVPYDEQDDPNLHYASYDLAKDTVPYQDPARVDDFIAKLAAYHNVKQGGLKCTNHADSNMVSTVYVFPDTKELDLFSRLLQVACCYSDETPGYFLNFSHQQFFFELKDLRRGLQYRWIAERVNGKILLYGTNAPLGTKESSACYQEYRDELMHINSINPKTKQI